MLKILMYTLLTAALLTLAGTTTSMADPGRGCGNCTANCNGYDVNKSYGYGNGYAAGNGYEIANDCGYRAGNGNCERSCNGYEDGSSTDLTTAEVDWMLFMREEEKLARDSYLALGDLWGLVIFKNIATSEQRHMYAMKKLINYYNLTDPVTGKPGTFSNPELQALFDFLMMEGEKSMMDSLYVGALIEETDMRDLQIAIDESNHANITSTYESLLCGSRNHLRSFIRKIEINGGTYIPTVLEEDEFWEIAHSQMEQGCGKRQKRKK